GRLLADGHGRLAHWHVGDWAASTVLDPADGHVIGDIGGRPLLWLRDGSLLAKTSFGRLQSRFSDAGELRLWSPGVPERRLAQGFVEVTNQPALAPSGQAIACYCAKLPPLPSLPAPTMLLRVPLDGRPVPVISS